MRPSTILVSLALLAATGVAGAQGTTHKASSHASAVATGARMAGPADTTAHAVNRSRRRRHRIAGSTTKAATKVAATKTATKTTMKSDSVAAKPHAMATHAKAPAKKP